MFKISPIPAMTAKFDGLIILMDYHETKYNGDVK